jgi:hypothetical protein
VLRLLALERLVGLEFEIVGALVVTAGMVDLKFAITLIPLHLAASTALGRDC